MTTKKNIIQYGIEKPKNPRKSKYPFAEMHRKGASFWKENISTQALLTSFKAWCSRNSKKWKAQCWTEINNGVSGSRIRRIK